jgi:hypothetical protein
MMPEAAAASHGYSAPFWSVGSLSSSRWQENVRPLLTREPTVYGEDKTDSMSDGPVPPHIYGR